MLLCILVYTEQKDISVEPIQCMGNEVFDTEQKDISVEPIQCTNMGNEVFDIGGKDYILQAETYI